MRINLIQDSFRNCLTDGKADAMVIPIASFYGAVAENVQTGNPPRFKGAIGWYLDKFEGTASTSEEGYKKCLTQLTSRSGGVGSLMRLSNMQNFNGVSDVYSFNTHRRPFEDSHYKGLHGIEEAITRLMGEIMRTHSKAENWSIGPLFNDPEHEICGSSKSQFGLKKDEIIQAMFIAAHKYQVADVFNIYTEL